MTKVLNKSRIFFATLLISAICNPLSGQQRRGDSLKSQQGTDTLFRPGEEQGDLEQKVTYSADDSVVALPGKGMVLLYGKAHVVYGSMNIEAAVVEIDYAKSLVTAYGRTDSIGRTTGSPVFRDGQETMEAGRIMYNLRTRKGKIFNAMTRQGELIVIGNEIKKDSNNVIYMRDMKCIPCQEASSRTMFRATKAKIIPDDKIVTGPMYLEVGGVPTPFGLPFGYFPNTKSRHNGIILPAYGFSQNQGFNLRQGGFYWGISDRTDLTLKGDIYANGSYALSAHNRYNFIYRSSGEVSLAYTQFDFGDKEVPQEFSSQRSYDVKWLHTQDNRSNPTVHFSANVNFVSNQNISRFTALNNAQFLRNNFNSNISFTKILKAGTLNMYARHQQASVTKDMTLTFPDITFNAVPYFPFRNETAVRQTPLNKVRVEYLVQARNQLTGKDSTILKGNIADSLQYGIMHSLPISTNIEVLKNINMQPRLSFDVWIYANTIRKTYDAESRRLISSRDQGLAAAYSGRFSTDFNTKVYFDYMFFRGGVKQIRHLMIPTLTYGFKPDFGDKKFGYWRNVQSDSTGRTLDYSIYEKGLFYGPGRGKENSLSLSINNVIDAKVRQRTDTGITWKKVSILQGLAINGSYNFAADSFRMSDISLSARTTLFTFFTITYGSAFSPYVYDRNLQRYVDRFSAKRGGLATFRNANIAVNAAFGSTFVEAMKRLWGPPEPTSAVEKGSSRKLDETAPLPWNISLNYNLSLVSDNKLTIQPTHQLGANADLMPTKFWKLGVSTGFDFVTRQASSTWITIYRDLKCWEASISWVPFGANQNYMLNLNMKSSMLRDVKIPKQKPFFD